jgi:hypothetical protein
MICNNEMWDVIGFSILAICVTAIMFVWIHRGDE